MDRLFMAGEGVISNRKWSPFELFLGVEVFGSSEDDSWLIGDVPCALSSSEDFSGVK